MLLMVYRDGDGRVHLEASRAPEFLAAVTYAVNAVSIHDEFPAPMRAIAREFCEKVAAEIGVEAIGTAIRYDSNRKGAGKPS